MSGTGTVVVLGLVLLFILPRHTFACVQSALFPKYMILNGVTALAVLISFVQTKKFWSSQENYQVNIDLFISFLFSYFFPSPCFSAQSKKKRIVSFSLSPGCGLDCQLLVPADCPHHRRAEFA